MNKVVKILRLAQQRQAVTEILDHERVTLCKKRRSQPQRYPAWERARNWPIDQTLALWFWPRAKCSNAGTRSAATGWSVTSTRWMKAWSKSWLSSIISTSSNSGTNRSWSRQRSQLSNAGRTPLLEVKPSIQAANRAGFCLQSPSLRRAAQETNHPRFITLGTNLVTGKLFQTSKLLLPNNSCLRIRISKFLSPIFTLSYRLKSVIPLCQQREIINPSQG